jgi:anti-sigma regulatory factor (Ser/Thr protein kinase)
MHGKTSTASQVSAGGRARHAGTAHWAAAPVVQDSPPASRVRAPARVLPPADAQGHEFGDRWPLDSFLELGALPGAVPCARLHVRQVLWEWRLSSLGDNAELLVSELVTNAVRISRADGAPVRLWLLSDGVCVLIVVRDASLLPPVRMDTGDDDESGRGLLLVDTLSARWSWYFPPRPGGGKVVWALVEAGLSMVTGYGRLGRCRAPPRRDKRL